MASRAHQLIPGNPRMLLATRDLLVNVGAPDYDVGYGYGLLLICWLMLVNDNLFLYNHRHYDYSVLISKLDCHLPSSILNHYHLPQSSPFPGLRPRQTRFLIIGIEAFGMHTKAPSWWLFQQGECSRLSVEQS